MANKYRVYLEKGSRRSEDIFADGFIISQSGSLQFYGDERGAFTLAYREWLLVELVK